MSLADTGLLIFVIALGLNMAGLALDDVLYRLDLTTMTDYGRVHTWYALFVVGVNVAGVVGITAHFFLPLD